MGWVGCGLLMVRYRGGWWGGVDLGDGDAAVFADGDAVGDLG